MELVSHVWVCLALIEEACEALEVIIEKLSFQGKSPIVVDVVDVGTKLLHQVESVIQALVAIQVPES